MARRRLASRSRNGITGQSFHSRAQRPAEGAPDDLFGPELLDGHLATALLQTPADAGQAAHHRSTNDNGLVSLSLLSEK